ncbi:FecR domain-containing protein [Comamonas koreensis]|uniref:FecR domain-containing protein n=1 Tax=Comamonas koreensis TaxID=160825 RepID=A0AAW4XTR5_9BURK|nr:FecR domain-containing protein [Comamonas koreensis]MCD2164106.1 FecR domain-containing protein [Comamonas koreensis]
MAAPDYRPGALPLGAQAMPTPIPTSAPTTIPPAVAQAAVRWLLDLEPGDSSSARRKRQQWQSWLDADPLHAQAWQRIAQVDGQLRGMPTAVAVQTLASPALSRRHAVRLAVMMGAGAGGLLALGNSPLGQQAWLSASADLSTATGEQQRTVLADGTRLLLNTATAVDLRYSSSERLIVLRAGEIQIESAADPSPDPVTGQPRPLRVRSSQGWARAIGTRFTVRQYADDTLVQVQEGQVELQLRHDMSQTLRLAAGQQGRIAAQQLLREAAAPAADLAWTQGMLVADDMRLGDFIVELARYRPGRLHCTPDAAALRVSGSYPLADTDKVLAALSRALPVRISSRTRWWVTVEKS